MKASVATTETLVSQRSFKSLSERNRSSTKSKFVPRANANLFMNFCNLKKGYSREGKTTEKGVFIGTFNQKG